MSELGTVAITGAGQGLGLALAAEFARRGRSVLALVLLPEQGDVVAARTAGSPGAVTSQVLDVTRPGDFAFPPDLAVLVNNAVIRLGNLPIEAIELDEWRRYFEVNFFGAVEMSRRAIPLMRRSGRGVICNINSASVTTPFPFLGPYRAAKGALGQFSETLRAEVHQFGIRVLEILPGGISTGLTATSMGSNRTAAADIPEYAALADNLLENFRARGMSYISAEEAAGKIADAVEEQPGRFRYGTDAGSDASIERWRAGGGDPAMREWIESISPRT